MYDRHRPQDRPRVKKDGIRRLLGLTFASMVGLSMMRSAVAHAADTALILGGSGIPTPPQSYVDAAHDLYLVPNGYGAYTPVPLTTPEQYYPLTGANQLTVDTSVAEGVTILDDAIRSQLTAGNHVVVLGYSQSSSVISQEAANLAASPNPPSPDEVGFILLGDPSTPNGGLTTRYQIPGTPPLSLPSLGLTFNTAPTAGTPYPTAVYNQEYDLAGDAPQYPLNFLSDLNATMGFITQHGGYLNLTPDQINSAVQLPTTGGNTTYYMIPTPNLPLLALVRLIPLVGDPLADLVQPDLRVLVNLGYGNIENGWSPGPADVPTPIGLWPTNVNPVDVLIALAKGIPQGISDAVNDLKSPQLLDLSPLSLFLAGANTVGWTPSANPSLLELLGAFAIVGNTGTPVTPANFGSSLLTLPKVLVDTAKTLAVDLPRFEAQLFTSQLAGGNVLNAIGLPIGTTLGVAPFILVAGAVFPIAEAIATPVTQLAQLAGLAPNPLALPATAASATPVSASDTKPVAAPDLWTAADNSNGHAASGATTETVKTARSTAGTTTTTAADSASSGVSPDTSSGDAVDGTTTETIRTAKSAADTTTTTGIAETADIDDSSERAPATSNPTGPEMADTNSSGANASADSTSPGTAATKTTMSNASVHAVNGFQPRQHKRPPKAPE